MAGELERLGLKINPFEPAASGVQIGLDLWIPERWRTGIVRLLDALEGSKGQRRWPSKGNMAVARPTCCAG